MNQSVTWTARTVAEALDLLDAVKERLESGMKAAYPGRRISEQVAAGRETSVSLSITFDASAVDRIANERSVFDAQVHDTP